MVPIVKAAGRYIACTEFKPVTYKGVRTVGTQIYFGSIPPGINLFVLKPSLRNILEEFFEEENIQEYFFHTDAEHVDRGNLPIRPTFYTFGSGESPVQVCCNSRL